MVFTGLTRAKENLVVFMEQDSPYLEFFSKHLNRLEVSVDASTALAAALDPTPIAVKIHHLSKQRYTKISEK